MSTPTTLEATSVSEASTSRTQLEQTGSSQDYLASELSRSPGIQQVKSPSFPEQIRQDLKKRRFNIAIDSIYYESISGGRSACAVLLTTSFDLQKDDNFAFAKVPFVVKKEANLSDDSVGISEYFPSHSRPEYVQVSRITGSDNINMSPVFRVDAGVGGEISGMGKDKRRKVDKPCLISLNSGEMNIESEPREIYWNYKDDNGIFYPPAIKLLVTVIRENNNNKKGFPFDLILKGELFVEIHKHGLSGFLAPVTRYFGKPPTHEGWFFHIPGKPYKSDLAQKALLEARNIEDLGDPEKVPEKYGLHAAARPWIVAQTSEPIFRERYTAGTTSGNLPGSS